MDVPKTTSDELRSGAAADVGAAGSAEGCPVDHAAAGSAAPEPAAPRAAIPATALPRPRMPALMQPFAYWKRPAAFMERCRERCGSRFALTIRIPPKPVYVLTDTEDVKRLFQAPPDVLHTGRSSATLEKYIGQTGLAWMDEDEHKARRKQLMPSMHAQIGILELKAMLREVLTQYELRRVDPQPEAARSRGVITVPAKGVRLELRSRSPEASLAGA